MKNNSARGAHSRYRIVAVAKGLFHQQGVRATRVDEIVQAAGVSRKEFDRSFRSKRQLAREVVLAYLAEIEAGSSRVHPKLASWSDFQGSLAEHIAFLKEFGTLRGCPLAIIGNELTEKDDGIRKVLSLVFEALAKRLTAFFRQEKAEGHLSKNAKEERLAEFCVAVIQGAMLIGKVRRESEAVESVFGEMVTHLEKFRLELNLRQQIETNLRKVLNVKALTTARTKKNVLNDTTKEARAEFGKFGLGLNAALRKPSKL